MSLKDIEIKDEYRSDDCPDLGTGFVSKVLEQTKIYKRAVGFFSSSALIKISKGISKMVDKPGCHIYFVVSPVLTREDVEAISKGYRKRREIVENALLREFKPVDNELDCERLNFLSHLIEENILDIKIADKFNEYDENDFGIFHEKIGIFIDEEDNKVAFTGSLNESDNAFSHNFESIQVFKSWIENKRVWNIENNFDRLWDDKTNTLEVYDFPEAVKAALFKYRKSEYHRNMDEYEKQYNQRKLLEKRKQLLYPIKPENITLYDYQKEAIKKWAQQKYRGLFDMGTGTGKTITALTASTVLLKKLNYKLATIIVCPYTHLVEQWVEESNNFNINLIIGYSDKKYKNYQADLAKIVQDYNDGIIEYFYFITTNDSYKTDKVQNILKNIKGKTLLIADEVQNFGSEGMQNALINSFNFRIGLSATIDRHRDEDGTKAIYEYFGDPVIHYGLKEAIQNDVLTRYYYYPVLVTLNSNELDDYIELTKEIRKCSYQKDGKHILTEKGKFLALKRSRIIATASSKLDKLRELISKYTNEHNILIYCGTGKVNGSASNQEIRQIDEVCRMLGDDYGMKIAKYTSGESAEQRKEIAARYKCGTDLQAVVAIKCLDEGVNIPSIKTAFILASSTNPREYIQRRGRVLRKFKGKKYSYIYDFVTLPFDLNDISLYDDEFIKSFRTMINNELQRIKEFSSLSENEHESDIIINKLTNTFKLNEFEIEKEFEQIDLEDINDGE